MAFQAIDRKNFVNMIDEALAYSCPFITDNFMPYMISSATKLNKLKDVYSWEFFR